MTMTSKLAAAIAAGVIGLLILFDGLYTLHETEQALIIRLGEPVRTELDAGLHLKFPFVETVVRYDNRILDLDTNEDVPREYMMADLLRLQIDTIARYRITDPRQFYLRVRDETGAVRQLQQIIDRALREQLSRVTLTDLLDREEAEARLRRARERVERERQARLEESATPESGVDTTNEGEPAPDEPEVEGGGQLNMLPVEPSTALPPSRRVQIAENLRRRIAEQVENAELGLEIVDFRIRRADLSDQARESVLQRMIAERQREAADLREQGSAEERTIIAQAERQYTRVVSSAEREALEIIGDADQQATQIYADAFEPAADFYAFYRSLEAYRQALANGNTSFVLTPDSDFFRFFTTLPDGAMFRDAAPADAQPSAEE